MVRDNKTGLTPNVVAELMRRGRSQQWIADFYGVSKQYVSQLRLAAEDNGLVTKSPREQGNALFPWPEVGKKYNRSQFDRKLRDHAEFMISNGQGMSYEKLYRLQGFYRTLREENLVVEFHPDIPPTKGSPIGGYAYRSKTPKDDDLIIRVNDLAVMTEQNRELWKYPPVLPKLPST